MPKESEMVRELTKKEIGSPCTFVDIGGNSHNALVIHAWDACLNIIYVDPLHGGTLGNNVLTETSVPFKEEGMTGFYIK